MVLSWNRLEVHDSVADDLSCLLGTPVWASNILGARHHRDGHLVDARDVDKRRMTMAIEVVWCILLEPISVGVLPPVSLRLDTLWLAPVTRGVLAGSGAKLIAHFFVIMVPIWTIHVVDADRWELVE